MKSHEPTETRRRSTPSKPVSAEGREVVPIGDATRPVLHNDPLSALAFRVAIEKRRFRWVVVLKASFDIAPGERARLRAEPEPLSGEVPSGDDPASSPRTADDFALMKPRVDVVLRGTAHPGERNLRRMTVLFSFGDRSGSFTRSLAVLGRRTWISTAAGEAPSEPALLQPLPLGWELAFGGEGHSTNPVGTGLRRSLPPQIEDPSALIVDRSSAPAPMGIGPMSRAWPARASKMGKPDARYIEERWPFVPADFSAEYFQCAPREQQLDRVRGFEPFTLQGLHPEHASIDGRLGGRVPVCGLVDADSGAIKPIAGMIDTVFFDTDAMRVDVVWRGAVDARGLGKAPRFVAALVAADAAADEVQEKLLLAHASAEGAVDDLRSADNDGDAPDPMLMHVARARERLVKAGIPVDPIEAPLRHTAAPPAPAPPPPDPAKRERVIAALSSRQSLEGARLTGADLSDLDLSGSKLARADLRGAILSRARFDGADLSSAQLGGAVAAGTSFAGATMRRADLTEARLDEASFVRADITEASFDRALLAGAKLDGARGRGARFEEADLEGATALEAELPSSIFSRAVLNKVRFEQADLTGASFYDASGSGVSFKKANAGGLRANQSSFEDASFQGIRANESSWDGATLERVDMSGADLVAAGFVEARLVDWKGDGANLESARFLGASLRRATARVASLAHASFEAAELADVDLTGANLHGAETLGASMTSLKRDGAIVTKTKWTS